MMKKPREEQVARKTNFHFRWRDMKLILQTARGEAEGVFIAPAEKGTVLYIPRETDQVYRVRVDEVEAGLVRLDERGMVVSASRRFNRLVKVSPTKLIGTSFSDWVVPADRKAFSDLFHNGLREVSSVTLTLRRSDGVLQPVEISFDRSDEKPEGGGILVVRAVAAEPTAEPVIGIDQIVRSILEQTVEPIVVCNVKGVIIQVSQAAVRLAGRNPVSRPFDEVFPLQMDSGQYLCFSIPSPVGTDGQRKVSQLPTFPCGQTFRGLEATFSRSDGQSFHLLVGAAPLIDLENRIIGCVIVLTDITERKMAEQSLRESEERFRGLVESTSDRVWEVDVDGVYTYMSPKVKDLLGYEPQEMLGRTLFDRMPSEELPRLRAWFDQQVRTGQPFANLENTHVAKDGRRIIFQTSGVPFFDADGHIRGYRGIDHDVTEHKRDERRLLQATAQFQAMFQAFPDLYFRLEPDGTIVDYGTGWIGNLYLPPEQFLGRRMQEVLPPEVGGQFARAIEQVRPGESPVIIEYTLPMPVGDEAIENRMYEARLVLTATGQIMVFVRDITARRRTENELREYREHLEDLVQQRTSDLRKINEQLQQEVAERQKTESELARTLSLAQSARQAAEAAEARYRVLLESAPDGIVVVDGEGKITLVNAQAEKMFGYSQAEMIGQPVEMLVPVRLRDQHLAERTEYMAAPRMRPISVGMDLCGQRKDGLIFPIEVSLSPIRDGGEVIITAIVHDITARKRGQDEVNRLNEDLKRRAADLELANQELEAFSYSVSHDLRAPLRSIDGFSQSILEDCAQQLGGSCREYFQRIRAASQRMAHLIDDLLNLSRVTRQEMHREQVDLSGLARSIASDLQLGQPERNAEFVIAPGLKVAGDPMLLRVALQNLLGNAWKFTSYRAEARIEFGVRSEKEEPVFFVRDNGAGFNMAYAGKLFAPFQRLHSEREFPGTGIGLATVQRIVRRHGGRVWAEGKVDEGATFYFTLNEKEAPPTSSEVSDE